MFKSTTQFVAILSTAVLLVVTSAGNGFAQKGIAVKQTEKQAARHQAIEKALDKDAEFDLSEVPLSELPQIIKDLFEIEVQLDRRAFEDVSISPDDELITKNLVVSLRSALNLILTDLDATFVIKNEVLLITTCEAADKMYQTKIYDVANLIEDEASPSKNDKYQKYSQLIKLLSTVQDFNKKGKFKQSSITPLETKNTKTLVIKHTIKTHREIEMLLTALMKLNKTKTPKK